MNRWDTPGVPHKGWTIVSVIDLRGDDPDALEAFTGTREIDGSAMVAYFEPLMVYLKEQNKGQKCGWQ